MSNKITLREFLPTILFLARFLGIYLVANLLYGFYVTSFEPRPDSITHIVARQTSGVLNACGWDTSARDNARKPTTEVSLKGRDILSIYEGCNGVNVMIIFAAFLLSFGPLNRALWWFLPLGVIVLHLANLGRISVLFWVSLNEPDFMYFLHKYFFTAVLYVVTFILWVIWVRMHSRRSVARA